MVYSKQRLTKQQALFIASAGFLIVIIAEGCCALRYIHQQEVLTGSLIVTSWFRDAMSVIVEHLFFDE